ncbi:hypothetical protein ACFYMW_31360 [Streptomyces sp. NPDC006692]|uniref:hypothetical protein n=1 Tax=Streptomyces sp. NPDC006692 TaxID=3364758 RepID=UPI003691FF4E
MPGPPGPGTRTLTTNLNTWILLNPHPSGDTAFYLLNAEGLPLRNHGGGPETDKEGRDIAATWLSASRSFYDDPAHGYAPDLPVTVFLKPVPGSSVGMAGNRGDTVEDAAAHITHHYRPALDPSAEPCQWDTPWRETTA